jgi:hypothetical protein
MNSLNDPASNPASEPAIDPLSGEPEPVGSLGLLKRSFILSIMIVCILMLTALLGKAFKPLSFLTWVADAIAWPPGLITNLVVHTNANSVASFAISAAVGLMITIVFYTVVAWIFLRFWPVLRSRSNKN